MADLRKRHMKSETDERPKKNHRKTKQPTNHKEKEMKTQNYSTTVSVKMHYYHFCWLLFYGENSRSLNPYLLQLLLLPSPPLHLSTMLFVLYATLCPTLSFCHIFRLFVFKSRCLQFTTSFNFMSEIQRVFGNFDYKIVYWRIKWQTLSFYHINKPWQFIQCNEKERNSQNANN